MVEAVLFNVMGSNTYCISVDYYNRVVLKNYKPDMILNLEKKLVKASRIRNNA